MAFKSAIATCLLLSVYVDAADYTSPKIIAWAGATSDKNLWIEATAPASADKEVAFAIAVLDATWASAELVVYGTDSDDAAASWTTTAGSETTGSIAFTTFVPDTAPAAGTVWFHASELTWLKAFAGTNTVDTTAINDTYKGGDATTLCELEAGSEDADHTAGYRLDLQVKCSGAAVAGSAKYKILILKDSHHAAGTFSNNANWKFYDGTSAVGDIDGDTDESAGGAYSDSNDLYHEFAWTIGATQVASGVSHYLTVVGTDNNKILSHNGTIFVIATAANGTTWTHISKGTFACTDENCPARATSSSSRIVSLVSIPALALLAALLQ